MDYRPLNLEETQTLDAALRRNAEHGEALHVSPRDTSWLATSEADDGITEVISAIRSVPCHYSDAAALALALLRESPEYLDDARKGAPVGNSVVGSLLSIQHGIPRQYAEAGVLDAIRILDSARAESIEPDKGGNITLPRSGTAALRFRGELVAEASSKRHQGPAENRWFELAVYRRESGGYVIAIAYRTCWQGEEDRDFAEPRDDAAGVRAAFESFDPCNPELWRGIPENVHDAGRRNAYYRTTTSAAYKAAVSELLRGDEFAEVLP